MLPVRLQPHEGAPPIWICTTNQRKYAISCSVFGTLKSRCVQDAEELRELQGDAVSVVRDKVEQASLRHQGVVTVEDDSVYLSALNGFPGPYAKDFMNVVGPAKICAVCDGIGDNRITITALVAVVLPDKSAPHIFSGSVVGTLSAKLARQGGIIDDVVVPDGDTRTVTEVAMERGSGPAYRMEAWAEAVKFIESSLLASRDCSDAQGRRDT